jgi:hypothetical protein
MIFGNTHKKLAATPGADGSGLHIEEDLDGGDQALLDEGGGKETVDRGDVVEPEVNPGNLAAVIKQGAAVLAEPTPEPGKEVKVPPGFVPIARLNEVIEQRRVLLDQVANLSTAAPAAAAKPAAPAPSAAPAFDELSTERKYAELLADGDFDAAAKLRLEINGHLEQRAEERFSQKQALAQAQSSVTEAAAQAVSDYPYLDTADGEIAMVAIVAQRDNLIRQGIAPGAALAQAVGEIAPKFAPEGSATPGKELQSAALRVDTRPIAAAARGLRDIGSQPPIVTAGAGNRATAGKVDVEDMTEAQFEALTPQEKSRLRGDV